jgi:molecular chaperone HtpG
MHACARLLSSTLPSENEGVNAMKQTNMYKKLKNKDEDDKIHALLTLVNEIFEECRQIHKTIIKNMPEYTLHDELHLNRVVELMDRLIPPSTLENLSSLELAALILSASLHDIGMAPSQEEVRALLGNPTTLENDYYYAFRENYPEIIKRQEELRSQDRHSEAQELEAYMLSHYLRETHSERARKLIFEKYRQKLIYADYNFTKRLADICCSHTKDPSSLGDIPCYELVRAPGEYANWRFIAVVLRLADILDFDEGRTPSVLFEHLGIRDNISLKEWEKHRSVKAWDIRPGRIAFSAKCPDPVIEKCVRDFIEKINQELHSARDILGDMHDTACKNMGEKYALDLPYRVDDRDIGAEEGPDGPIYEYLDLGFYLDEESIISLIMGMNLYGDRLLFLRELLQNAVDTCRYRKVLEETAGNFLYTPKITVRLYQKTGKWFLAVEDNGMGMDKEIVTDHFARIGKSYYQSGRFLQEKAQKDIVFQPISVFGIGILSVFMVADHLRVETRKLKNNLQDLETSLDIELSGPTKLFWFRKSNRIKPGTRLVLSLEEDPLFLKNGTSLVKTIEQLAPHAEFPITVCENERKYKVKGTWQLPDIEKPEYEEFYCQITLDFTLNGPKGLDGKVKTFLLKNYEGKFARIIELKENIPHRRWRDEESPGELHHSSGSITHWHRKRSGVSFSSVITSRGRLAVNGFFCAIV